MKQKTYTLLQIRQAFFDMFHEMGEFNFPFEKDETDENYEITNSYFEEFVWELERQKNENHN